VGKLLITYKLKERPFEINLLLNKSTEYFDRKAPGIYGKMCIVKSEKNVIVRD